MKITRSCRLRIVGSLMSVSAIAVQALTQISWAQETAERSSAVSDRIMVTARRTEERLQDVPSVVSVLDASTLQTADVERVEDFIGLVSGVSLTTTSDSDTQINIRGLTGTRDGEASFAYILDGVLYTNPIAINRRFTSLRQIEIVKGPQSAIYGRNAAAGAIIVKTRKPDNEFGVIAEANYGEDSTRSLNASVEGPIVKDKLFFRLGVDSYETDGFYSNTFQNNREVVDDFDEWNINARFVATPTERLEIDSKFRYGEHDGGAFSGFDIVFALPDFVGGLGPTLFEDVNNHEFGFNFNNDSLRQQETTEFSTNIDYRFDFADLTFWALYSNIENALGHDGASGGFFNDDPTCRQSVSDLNAAGVFLPEPQSIGATPEMSFLGPFNPTTCEGTQFQIRDQEDLSFEVRLAGLAVDDRLSWEVGTYFLDLDREVGVNTGLDTGDGVTRQLFVPQGQPNPTEQLVHDKFDTEVFAVFGQLGYDLTDRMNVSFAGRWDREERKVTNLVPTDARSQFIDFDGPPFNGGAPLNPSLDPEVNPTGIIPDRKEVFTQFQPKVSANYDISNYLTAFASWGVGFKSGGFNNTGAGDTVDLLINQALGTNIAIGDEFREETNASGEVGLKGYAFDRALRYEAAAYYTDVDDMQFFEFLVGSFGLLRVVSNIDDVEVYGAEASISWDISDNLSTWISGNVTESEIKENSVRPATVGNKSPHTPDFTINFGFQLNHPINDSVEAVLRADTQVVGPTWFHTVQDNVQPSTNGVPSDFSKTQRSTYAELNIRAGIRTGNWEIMLYGDNLNDSDHLEEVVGAPESGGAFVHAGPRRRAGVELRYHY